jgi:hypothetical protein
MIQPCSFHQDSNGYSSSYRVGNIWLDVALNRLRFGDLQIAPFKSLEIHLSILLL